MSTILNVISLAYRSCSCYRIPLMTRYIHWQDCATFILSYNLFIIEQKDKIYRPFMYKFDLAHNLI